VQRRTFIQSSVLLLAGARAFGATTRAAHRPLGLQLYTVMPLLQQDFAGTLQAVAAIGYQEVETIGTFGRDPAELRALFDKYNLRSPSQHMVPGNLYEVFNKLTRKELSFEQASRMWQQIMSVDRIEPIMEECIRSAKALGQKYIVWQILWPEQMKTRALLEKFCTGLNEAGRLAAREGHVLNYHNHAAELKPHDGVIPYDFILANTDPQLVKMELDCFWTVAAGADPADYFRKYPGRFRQCHLKDGTAKGDVTVVGEGIMKFGPLLTAARAAGVEHYYVEQDGAAEPLKASTQAYQYLRRYF
jgi:sugar phosphate isomerase/epimerase